MDLSVSLSCTCHMGENNAALVTRPQLCSRRCKDVDVADKQSSLPSFRLVSSLCCHTTQVAKLSFSLIVVLSVVAFKSFFISATSTKSIQKNTQTLQLNVTPFETKQIKLYIFSLTYLRRKKKTCFNLCQLKPRRNTFPTCSEQDKDVARPKN